MKRRSAQILKILTIALPVIAVAGVVAGDKCISGSRHCGTFISGTFLLLFFWMLLWVIGALLIGTDYNYYD